MFVGKLAMRVVVGIDPQDLRHRIAAGEAKHVHPAATANVAAATATAAATAAASAPAPVAEVVESAKPKCQSGSRDILSCGIGVVGSQLLPGFAAMPQSIEDAKRRMALERDLVA